MANRNIEIQRKPAETMISTEAIVSKSVINNLKGFEKVKGF